MFIVRRTAFRDIDTYIVYKNTDRVYYDYYYTLKVVENINYIFKFNNTSNHIIRSPNRMDGKGC